MQLFVSLCTVRSRTLEERRPSTAATLGKKQFSDFLLHCWCDAWACDELCYPETRTSIDVRIFKGIEQGMSEIWHPWKTGIIVQTWEFNRSAAKEMRSVRRVLVPTRNCWTGKLGLAVAGQDNSSLVKYWSSHRWLVLLSTPASKLPTVHIALGA